MEEWRRVEENFAGREVETVVMDQAVEGLRNTKL